MDFEEFRDKLQFTAPIGRYSVLERPLSEANGPTYRVLILIV